MKMLLLHHRTLLPCEQVSDQSGGVHTGLQNWWIPTPLNEIDCFQRVGQTLVVMDTPIYFLTVSDTLPRRWTVRCRMPMLFQRPSTVELLAFQPYVPGDAGTTVLNFDYNKPIVMASRVEERKICHLARAFPTIMPHEMHGKCTGARKQPWMQYLLES